MSKSIKSFPLSELNNFDKICSYLVNYIRKSWNVENLEPKNKKVKFNGPDTSSAASFSVEDRLNYENAMFDKEDQGRDFLTTLVSSCIAYGMIIEKEREERIKNFKDKIVEMDFEEYISKKDAIYVEDIKFLKEYILNPFVNTWTIQTYENDFESYKKERLEENAKISKLVDEILKERNKNV